MTIKKVLIANRGEIAIRVNRTCRELGLTTVAVFSDVDRRALHVRYADEAYLLGPAPSKDSYLNIDRIIQISKDNDVDAIHPGYGFLSENHEFAKACEDAGITFIGPSAEVIRLMGDKETARDTMIKAGIPVVPGTEGKSNLSDSELVIAAEKIGFPLLIKASAGGGGKGMRKVYKSSELKSAIKMARTESQSAFGDDNVYIEKLIEKARHIEFQILADQHGNTIHLGERECSIQRRHQKLLEEAPSPYLNTHPELRQKMGETAVKAAKVVNYENAGTIEFLVDKEDNFYFLEMNTRLQVEHPITEAITGIDIVEEQIRIARGRQLSITQDELKINGWAIECRINSEDAYNNFLPSVGVITEHAAPSGPGVRIDTGVYNSYEITTYYDPLISKLIVWGKSRAQAILRTRRALEEYKIVGIVSNLPFHLNLISQTRFMAGNYDSQFVEERFSMRKAEEGKETYPEIAAIFAALSAFRRTELSAHIIRRAERDTSNWKWIGRWERMHR